MFTGHLLDWDIFYSLGTWINTFLSRTARLSSLWWDLVTDYRQFWDSLAMTMPIFLKRRYVRR